MTLKPQHLHPLALIQFSTRTIRDTFLYVVLAVIFCKNQLQPASWIIIVCALIGLAIVVAILRYWRFTYQITPTDISINKGLIFRKQLQIPYSRIQTLQVKQWFYLKPFHLTAVSIETSGHDGDDADASLPVVSQQIVDELRRLKRASGQLEQPKQPKIIKNADPTYAINWADLNTYALTSMGLVPILLGIWALYNKLDDLVPEHFKSQTINSLVHLGTLMLVGVLLVGLLLSLVLSYLSIIQRYYHFKLTLRGHELVTEKGFFQRNTITAAQNRIQAVVLRQTILRQLFHLISVQVLLASTATTDEDNDSLVILPVISETNAAVVRHYLPNLPENMPRYNRITRGGKWRLIRNAMLEALVLVVPICWFFRPWGLLSLLLFPLAWLFGWYAGRNAGVVWDSRLLFLQIGKHLHRETYVVEQSKIQSVTLKETFWMKSAGFMHVVVNIRQGNGNAAVEVRYLPTAVGQQLYDWYR
ncbi:PH domain-containing protein [Secundilactobacillus collinoides]|uniref:Membrane protein n=2 Tax=Secundilactobacillus collinoides TaxID=33960 RepID=A0A0R2B7A6_SECCO|nr:PH domain-containing protein [Secundilactobacillus collinoides]KRM75201.1 membrane protein [Secundilactobacillus collinoides DSM 20515 = JCM 1123]KZL35921.1 hypothetical protein TY91_15075 [Secundilactobacillus collinoides]